MPGEAFARLYGLTGGELRILVALAQGMGAKEAADMLGIGEPTVRTHLQRIFFQDRNNPASRSPAFVAKRDPADQYKAPQLSRSLTA